MADPREGTREPLPIHPRVVRQQAQQTIRSLVDAVVELVTNADDSYRRLEAGGSTVSGRIDVSIVRRMKGEWDALEVRDQAEGMHLDRLLKIVEYAAPSSGFEEGRSVRGMFGRGMKEAAIALGAGLIQTMKDGRESEVRISWDQESQRAMREILKAERSSEGLDGTKVTICSVGHNEYRCPTFEALCSQVATHYALRDINKNRHREVFLTMENQGGGRGRGARPGKLTHRLAYEPPPHVAEFRETIDIPELGKATIELYESEEMLRYNQYDPCSTAGLVVKTEGAALDLSLFGYDNWDAARFFFGVVYCPGIARAVREGNYALIDADRSGLQWKNPLCIHLFEEVKKAFGPHVERKQKELSAGTNEEVPEKLKKKLANLCALLNRLAKLELDEAPVTGVDNGVEPSSIVGLTLKPEIVNAKPKQVRTFSVYLPRRLATGRDVAIDVETQDVIGRIRLLEKKVNLRPHSKHPELLMGQFQISGDADGDKCYVYVRYDSYEDMGEFRVQPPGHREKGPLTGHKGGMFREIKFDSTTQNPPQRVSYSMGDVIVYLNFPPIGNYLQPGGKGHDQPQGSLMLAELVAEVFCRDLARRKAPERPVAPGGEVDNYNRIANELMAKHLGAIHKTLVV